MEAKKTSKFKMAFNYVSKTISYTILSILIFIGLFLIFYIISGKIAQSKGQTPPLGLFTIISPSMTDAINVYDVVFTKKVDTNTLVSGDVITFYSTNPFYQGTPITHRIVDVINVPDTGKMFVTKGDANLEPDKERVYPVNVVGKVLFKIPQLGRLQFFLASKSGWLIAILIPSLAILAYDIFKVFRLILLKGKLVELRNKNDNI